VIASASSAGFEELVLRLLAEMLNRPVAVRSVAPKGYRSDWAGVVALGAGADSMFIKARSGSAPISRLEHERGVLEALPAGLGPSVRGWRHEPRDEVAVLALDDLSANRWPPPWSAENINQTIDLLNRIATVDLANSALPRLADIASQLGNWATIAAAPAPFLATGLRSAQWLDRLLPLLLGLEFGEYLDGDQLTHFDVRSDNICFGRTGPVLIDWEDCCLGNSRIDLLSWLPSLRLEGGPVPWSLAPDAELGLVAFLAGYWSSQAGLPEPAGAPGLRRLQRAQASVSLDWLDVCLSAA
jgi:phosphotransferase family enzyme